MTTLYNWNTPISALYEDGYISKLLEIGFENYNVLSFIDLQAKRKDLPSLLKEEASKLCDFLEIIIKGNFNSLQVKDITSSLPINLFTICKYSYSLGEENSCYLQTFKKVFDNSDKFLAACFLNKNKILDIDYSNLQYHQYKEYREYTIFMIESLRLLCPCFPDCLYYAKYFESIFTDQSLPTEEIIMSCADCQYTGENSIARETSYETLNKIFYNFLANCSVRVKNVLRINGIYKYDDFWKWTSKNNSFAPLKHCGRKSELELDSLKQKLNEASKQSKASSSDNMKGNGEDAVGLLTDCVANIDSVLVKTKIVLVFDSIHSFASEFIDSAVRTYNRLQALKHHGAFYIISKIIENIGRFIISNASNSASNAIRNSLMNFVRSFGKDRQKLHVLSILDKNKEKLIISEFKTLTSSISARSRNAMLYQFTDINIDNITNFVVKDQNFLDIENIGKKCAIELTDFKDIFIKHFAQLVFSDASSLEYESTAKEFGFLGFDEVRFVHDFKSSHKHYPMLFISERFFQNSLDYRVQIYSSYYGIKDNIRISIDDIAQKLSFTRERVRQIVYSPDNWIYKVKNSPFIDNSYWNYIMESNNIVTEEDSYILQLKEEERTSLSFCSIYGIVKIVRPICLESITLNNGDLKYYITSDLVKSFHLNKAIKELKRLNALIKNTDIIMPLYDFFASNNKYWTKGTELTKEKTDVAFKLLLEVIKYLDLGETDGDGNIIFKANKINYANTIYEIIKANGSPMHIKDIFSTFKRLYPNDKHKTPNSLRLYIMKDNRIENIGLSSKYKLASWRGYTGSIPELLVKLLNIHSDPVELSKLAAEALKYRQDSTKRSIESNISQKVNDGTLCMYYPNLVGLSGKKYDSKFKAFPRSFEEFLRAYVDFVEKHKRYPILNKQGYEGMLCRWHEDASNLTSLSDDEIITFSKTMNKLEQKHYPHGIKECNFLENCNQYKEFVSATGRLLNADDDKTMYYWFLKSSREYTTWEDNRKFYFQDLLEYIKKQMS